MKSFEGRLEMASSGWVQAGLISDAQRAAILRQHPAAANHSRFIAIVGTIGGLL